MEELPSDSGSIMSSSSSSSSSSLSASSLSSSSSSSRCHSPLTFSGSDKLHNHASSDLPQYTIDAASFKKTYINTLLRSLSTIFHHFHGDHNEELNYDLSKQSEQSDLDDYQRFRERFDSYDETYSMAIRRYAVDMSFALSATGNPKWRKALMEELSNLQGGGRRTFNGLTHQSKSNYLCNSCRSTDGVFVDQQHSCRLKSLARVKKGRILKKKKKKRTMVNKNNSLMMLQRNSMSMKQLDMVEDKLTRRKSISMWRQGVIRNYTDTMMMMMRERKISSSLKKNETIMLQTQPAAMATAMEASFCTRRRRRNRRLVMTNNMYLKELKRWKKTSAARFTPISRKRKENKGYFIHRAMRGNGRLIEHEGAEECGRRRRRSRFMEESGGLMESEGSEEEEEEEEAFQFEGELRTRSIETAESQGLADDYTEEEEGSGEEREDDGEGGGGEDERMKRWIGELGEVVPGGHGMREDVPLLLQEAAHYISSLQLQVQALHSLTFLSI